jgi:hypothetical protein
MSLRLKSLYELGRLLPEGSARFAELTKGILQSARAANIPVTEKKRRKDGTTPVPDLGSGLPGDMEFVRLMLDEVGREAGDSVYRLTSAFVHGETHIADLLSVRRDQPPLPDSTTVTLGMRLDNFILFSSSTVLAVHSTALAAVFYAGLPASVWQDLAQPLLQRWRASVHSARDTAALEAP